MEICTKSLLSLIGSLYLNTGLLLNKRNLKLHIMEILTDLKAILHSKRANIYYLEYCRVMQKDGRVLYLTEEKKQNQYWNIPIANTTCLLLGSGTSITQAAMRMVHCRKGSLEK